MAEPKAIAVRQPAVAGMFYPGDAGQCRATAASLVRITDDEPDMIGGRGGIIPHAGWICSGAIAGQVLGVLARCLTPDVVVVFGAVHTPVELAVAALGSYEIWNLPGGGCEVAAVLNQQLTRNTDLFVTDDRFHLHEHAVEVELPLVKAVWPRASVLPVEVPPLENAAAIGMQTARLLLEHDLKPVFLASSDLTHYGPSYRFAPVGIGEAALNWAKSNDCRLLELVEKFDVDGVLPEVRGHMNACGAGAIVSMMAACREAGASGARVIRHANSYETLAQVAPQPPIDAVGYAGVVVA